MAPLLAAKLLNVVPAATRSKIDGMSKLLDDQETDALNDFQAVADADPRDVEPLIWIADIAKSSGDPDRALRALDKCAELDRWKVLCGNERVGTVYAMHVDGNRAARTGRFEPGKNGAIGVSPLSLASNGIKLILSILLSC